jgi:hypothetical protein
MLGRLSRLFEQFFERRIRRVLIVHGASRSFAA